MDAVLNWLNQVLKDRPYLELKDVTDQEWELLLDNIETERLW